MALSMHHFLNEPMNWSPLSDWILDGQPNMLNHVSSTLITDWVEVKLSFLYRGNPDHLSTQIECFLPAKLNRSRPTCAIGAPKAVDGGAVVLGLYGWLGRRFWH